WVTDNKPLFVLIKQWIDALPDAPITVHSEGLWSCHAISRAVKLRFALEDWFPVEGYFLSSQHSWLRCGTLIMDTYPVAASGGPLVIDQDFWRRLYQVDDRYVKESDKQLWWGQAQLLAGYPA